VLFLIGAKRTLPWCWFPVCPWCFWVLLFPISLHAQVAIFGRVIDESGAAVSGAGVELHDTAGATGAVASSDPAGNFSLSLGPFAPGAYAILGEHQGFYRSEGHKQEFADGPSELVVTLNHLQEFSDHIDVSASSPPSTSSNRRNVRD
jgi:Carboxypeptidase regulatory-like domain